MTKEIISPVKKQNSVLHPVLTAILTQQKFFKEHFAKGGTFKELKDMGYKFGKVDLQNRASGQS